MAAQTALIIDDEPDIRELVSITVSRLGLDCHTAANLGEAKHVLDQCDVDVCLTDMRLPDGNGVDFVKYMQEHHPDIPVAVITAHGNMDSAVTAMKNGAFDFVSKPVDLKLLRKLIESAAKSTRAPELPQKKSAPNKAANDDKMAYLNERLLGTSPPMQALKKLILKLSKSQAPVLINGESGTGKELVARLIHETGPRADKPFVPVNCGAIPAELMESEFFGHKKGSFTGAHEDKIGLFQAAEDGTLFLDEVAELPLFMQVKLLRVIQEKAVKPVGGVKEIPVNVRILSASYKDLSLEVNNTRFRQDLFYRLNVIGLAVPSLRDRTDDLEPLTQHIVGRLTKNLGEIRGFEITSEASQSLSKHSFPGNVRELENILERAMTFSDGTKIRPEDLVFDQLENESSNSQSLRTSSELSLKEMESSRIVEALEKTKWNRKKAAEKLGISYRQLRYKITKLGLDKINHD